MIQPLVMKVLVDKMSLHCLSCVFYPLSSHVRFPSSNHFTNLKHSVEAYLQFESSELAYTLYLWVHMILKINSDYVSKHS